jgi:CRISPR-associated protein Csm3
MELLEDDYLGGYGSRGAGKVTFQNVTVVFKSHAYYEGMAELEVLAQDVVAVADLRPQDYVLKIRDLMGG